MKIEKLNVNTLKIILTVEELSLKNITIKDIEAGKKKAKNFFFDIIEDSNYADEFLKDNEKLLVEAAISKDNNLIVTITKINSNLSEMKKMNCNTKNITSSIYVFHNLEHLREFCIQAIKSNLYIGTNNLYIYNSLYILEFSKSTIANINFKKTFWTLIEYSEKHYSSSNIILKLKENSSLLIKNTAVINIANYILE